MVLLTVQSFELMLTPIPTTSTFVAPPHRHWDSRKVSTEETSKFDCMVALPFLALPFRRYNNVKNPAFGGTCRSNLSKAKPRRSSEVERLTSRRVTEQAGLVLHGLAVPGRLYARNRTRYVKVANATIMGQRLFDSLDWFQSFSGCGGWHLPRWLVCPVRDLGVSRQTLYVACPKVKRGQLEGTQEAKCVQHPGRGCRQNKGQEETESFCSFHGLVACS